MLSVVIPCLNAETLLPTQLQALARQHCPEKWEVIVADNGSTDRTRAVAESFRGRLPAIRIVSAERRGRHHACNLGAASALGTNLVFLDADDEAAPGYLVEMLRGLEEHPLVGGRLEHRRLNPAAYCDVGEMQSDGLMLGLGVGPFVMGASLGVRRSVFEQLGGFRDTPYCEDVDFCWRAQLIGVRPVFLPEAVVHYRQRSTATEMFRQHCRFGAAHVLLYRDFRSHGMLRRPAAEIVRDWLIIGKGLPALLRSRTDARLRWLRRFARAMGRLSGSVRYRVFYP